MRVFLLVTLVVLSIVAYIVWDRRASTPDATTPGSAENGSTEYPEPVAIDPESEGYWAEPLPAGYVEVTDPDVKPEFTVEVTPEEVGERRTLKFTVREKTGLRVDAIQLKVTHFVKDPETGELVIDQRTDVPPLTHFVRKPLEGGVVEDSTTLTTLEFSELADGKLGTSENWQAEVVSYSRLARKIK